MSEHQSAARQALLTDAAAQLGDGAAAAKVGDGESYLHSYYRHVDSSDLIAAGPRRVGAVAYAHAELAGLRPQGRAVVRVRPGADATLLPDRDVIDVVTDDMPFLVDTLTMTLDAHDVDPEIVVHPQLTVRRDVTGALREVIKPDGVPRDRHRRRSRCDRRVVVAHRGRQARPWQGHRDRGRPRARAVGRQARRRRLPRRCARWRCALPTS